MKNRFHHAIALFLVVLVVWLVSSPAAEIHAPRTKIPANFYQVIISNNLFRPLGWTKPKPKPAFELIATVMKSDSRLHKALIRNTRNRQLHYVAVGELAGEAIVEKMEAHRVTLNRNGESKVYRLSL